MPVNFEGRKQVLKEDMHGGLSADAGTSILLPGLAMSWGGTLVISGGGHSVWTLGRLLPGTSGQPGPILGCRGLLFTPG